MKTLNHTLKFVSACGALSALTALPVADAEAAVLAEYEFTGGVADSTDVDTASDADDFVTAGAATVSSFSGTAFLRADATADNQNDALDDTDYFGFSVDVVNVGDVLSLDSITFTSFIADAGAPGEPADEDLTLATLYVQSDVDGFGSAAAVIASFDVTSSTPSTFTVDLSDPSFDGLTDIEFRFYVSDDSTDSSDVAGRLDDVVLNGEVGPAVIPEPASLVLLSLGGLVIAGRRRRA